MAFLLLQVINQQLKPRNDLLSITPVTNGSMCVNELLW